jgi:hypothetical protein
MLELLMVIHQSYSRLDHIEKHLSNAYQLIKVLLGENPLEEKMKALSGLRMEFGIIKSDAECALLCLGDGQEE